MLDVSFGQVLEENILKGLKNYEIRMDSDGEFLFVGTHGYGCLPYLPDFSDWMEKNADYIKTKKLKEITIPGSHDSGTSEINEDSIISHDCSYLEVFLKELSAKVFGKKFLVEWSKTQDFSILHQLKIGIRYLDIRLCRINGNIYVCHGLTSVELCVALTQIKDFLKENTKEIIILDIQHIYGFSGSQSDEILEQINHIIGQKLYPSSGVSLSDVKISDIWEQNKNVLAVITDDVKTDSPYFTRSKNLTSEFFNVQKYGDLKEKISQETAKKHDKPWVLQCVLTPDEDMIRDDILFWTKSDFWKGVGESALEAITFGLYHSSYKRGPNSISDLAEDAGGLFDIDEDGKLLYENETNIIISDFVDRYPVTDIAINKNKKL